MLGDRSIKFWEFLAWGLSFFALALFRWQFILDEHISWTLAWRHGLGVGWLYDAITACLPLVVARLFTGILQVPFSWGWALSAGAIWLIHFANALYVRFFGARLDFWIVTVHYRDILDLDSAIVALAWTFPLMLSLGLVCVSVAFIFWKVRRHLFDWRARIKLASVGLAILGVVMILQRVPQWLEDSGLARQSLHSKNLLTTHLLGAWWKQIFNQEMSLRHRLMIDLHEFKRQGVHPQAALAQLRDGHFPGGENYVPLKDVQPLNPQWPLHIKIGSLPKMTQAYREQLGLPLTGKINVILLFLESSRAFEFEHPNIGPYIFPNLKSIFSKHAIYFRQAYSSSGEVGETVRAQFCTYCSMLPNFGAPAVFSQFNKVKVTCLQSLLQHAGYHTLMATGYDKNFHGKYKFEKSHGTQEFFDQVYFRSVGVTEENRGWGLADKPTLAAFLSLLEERSSQGPFFASLATLSTHYPYPYFPEGELPSHLKVLTDGYETYAGYLSALKYMDAALGNFFTLFFKSPLAENTLVVLQADHGTYLKPAVPLEGLSPYEYEFRIPIALITKHLKTPRVVSDPVHQADIAPTVLRILGLTSEVSWMGRGLLSGAGLPWVFFEDGRLFYRTQERACYTQEADKIRCWDVRGNRDPLFETQLSPLSENEAQTDFFMRVVKSVRLAITANLLMPHKFSWVHHAPKTVEIEGF